MAQSIFSDWHPAVPGQDIRGPCPGLNALANHNILPRSGQNLTVPTVVAALGAGVNISTEIATLLAMSALKTSDNPASGAFTLADLNKHNLIEHDGSLSRRDQGLQEGGKVTATLDEDVFDEFLKSFNGSQSVSLPAAAAARWSRIQASRKTNPHFSYTTTNRFSSYSETGVYYMVLQDPTTGTVPIDYLKILFKEERLPYVEGWRPVTPINGFSFGNTLLALAISTPEEEASDLVVAAAAS
ncbi:Chloroperoxidase [Periconia macrospinosa]|uniref:Chloroperoxidase n=1 Tax=Periconia macrospinosa TaxID=97972 RepID=A0A2V1DYX5_9PLEO|nr:Chloroperoxidase [Periconia macrospinosa]